MFKIKTRTSLYIMVGILSGAISLTATSVASNTVFAKNVDYKVNLESSLVVTVPTNTVVLDINPATSAFSSKDLGVTVGTNNPTGYTLTMSADSTDLTKTTGTAAVIPTLEELSGGYTESNFTVNHWGYKLPTTNYLPFTTSVQLDSTDAPTVSKTSTVTFGAKANVEQPAGAYELEINFAAVANPLLPTLLYDNVASLSKGKNTDPESHFSWTEITEPTSEIPGADTSTSGVFEWDGMTAGNGVDSNGGNQKIYFYRGILNSDSSGTYGSNGSANAYPNYVKLANNTCWRIVRTTSTGGVKIIYNGTWNSSTSTCANTTTAARLKTSPFNDTSATIDGNRYTGIEYHNIHAVGYTYSGLAAGTDSATPISTIFGSTGNETTTNTNPSTIKQYIEDWYEDNMTDYTSKLEGDAGYCNDRTLNTGTSWTTPLADNAEIIPYGTSGLTVYNFGSRIRNASSKSTFSPTLTCPRGKVDLYSYASNAGNGNGQLTYPVALLTADEASLAGNGWDNSFSAYNANSYLNSGSNFWLLSPSGRRSDGYASGFCVISSGYLYSYNYVNSADGVRPVISLAPGTTVLGSGTATDPWVVQ